MSLHPPPTRVETELFTRMPEEFRIRDRDSDWALANKPGERADSFLEGPAFDDAGNLYLVDIPWGRIFRVSPLGEWSLLLQYDGWPNGLKVHRDGMLYVADYRRGLLRVDPGKGSVEPWLTHRNSESFRGLNDLVFGHDGTLYFTDQGQTGMHDPSGRVYRYAPASGRLDCLVANGPSPNGLALSPDGKVLYVAMTRGNAVWRLPLRADGGVSKASVFTAMAGGVSGADGVAVDEAGNVFVCDAGNGCVWSFSPFGEPLHRYVACSGGRTVTNLAFGDADRRMLYIVDSSTASVVRAAVAAPGLRLR
ncbi:MAG: SMP-30/gluconolactonase/LRE family protein [Burkholderiaceae bacterium]|nr:SMP-30/gluconolactonase/LRE family protein [Burkholderiaceae bacterium]